MPDNQEENPIVENVEPPEVKLTAPELFEKVIKPKRSKTPSTIFKSLSVDESKVYSDRR